MRTAEGIQGFHPSKEVSEALATLVVSQLSTCFHPSKEVSEASKTDSPKDGKENGFHPSKEVSEALRWSPSRLNRICFHPSKEVSEGPSTPFSPYPETPKFPSL